MDDLLGLFILIGIAAGLFWAGFYFGYRHRDKLSIQRHKGKHHHNRPSASRETSQSETPPASP